MAEEKGTTTSCLVVASFLDVPDGEGGYARYAHGEQVTLSTREFNRLSAGRRPAVASEDTVKQARIAQAQAQRDAAQAVLDQLTAQQEAAVAAGESSDTPVNPDDVGDSQRGVDNPIGGGVVNLETETDDVGDVNPPPLSGRGSGEDAWREYARTVGDPDWQTAPLADLKARHGDTGTDADNG